VRKPKRPPDFEKVGERIRQDAERFLRSYEAVPGPLAHGRYLHWDKLVHYPPPEGLSHEEWWFALAIQRRILFKEVPLRDKEGAPFNYLEVDPIPERLHEIAMGAGGLIEMPEQITNPDTRDRYYVSSLIEEAITSSQLEGAATTRQVARDMLRSRRKPTDRGERMILNNFLTMQRIGGLKNEPLTRELVFEMHRLITDQTLREPTSAGAFRRAHHRVAVVNENGQLFHDPPPAEELAERMAAMCDFANGKTPEGFIHPVVRSIILHFWLAYDHPFADGNGRTARALFYWSMLRHGFWLFAYVSISQVILRAPSKYARAFLYTETDQNDLTYFVLYHLEVIRQAIKALHAYIKRKTGQLQVVERQLKGVGILNHRQRALIGHALRHPHHRYTIEYHRTSHDIVHQTARADLLALRRRGLLEGEKVGKTWYFTPVDNLESKLAKLS